MSFLPKENKSDIIKDSPKKNNDNDNIKLIKDKNKLIKELHPLEFYALGKTTNSLSNNSSTFFNSSSLSSPRLRVNHSSHGLFDRNILSVNSSCFDDLKHIKNIPTLNKNENNYLNPLLIYKLRKEEKKENQKRNNINSLEWLNIIKNKLFSIDINSKIKNGKNITRNKFYEQKKNLILSPRIIKDNSIENDNHNHANNTSYQFDSNNNSLEGYDYNYNTSGSFENIFNCKRFKKDNELLNKLKKINIKQEKYSDYWQKLRIEKSHSTDSLFNKDFKKYEEKQLKNNILYFDKNNKNIIRDRNWWKIDP